MLDLNFGEVFGCVILLAVIMFSAMYIYCVPRYAEESDHKSVTISLAICVACTAIFTSIITKYWHAEPNALDVYRGKTVLQVKRDAVGNPIDSTVIWNKTTFEYYDYPRNNMCVTDSCN